MQNNDTIIAQVITSILGKSKQPLSKEFIIYSALQKLNVQPENCNALVKQINLYLSENSIVK
jgi:hypothetical protein